MYTSTTHKGMFRTDRSCFFFQCSGKETMKSGVVSEILLFSFVQFNSKHCTE